MLGFSVEKKLHKLNISAENMKLTYSYLFWCPSSESNNPVENLHHLCVDNIDLYIIDTLSKGVKGDVQGVLGGRG